MKLPPEDKNDDRTQNGFDPNARTATQKGPGQLDIEHRQSSDGNSKKQGKKRAPTCEL